jgi:outer membrane protein OmpA-like peptidoglycan-associated protein
MRGFEVHFSRNNTSLSDDDIKYVAMAADYYEQQEFKPDRVFVYGHADTSEGADDGQAISLSRVIAVEYQLIKDGVPGSKIVVTAYGDRHPLIITGPNVPNAINRYVDVTLD